MKTFVGILFLIIVFGQIQKCNHPTNTDTNTAVKTVEIETVQIDAYERDLENRCKDWLFYRNRAVKLGREGDREGATKAGNNMREFDAGMRKHFTSEQISREISRLEESGYKGGF